MKKIVCIICVATLLFTACLYPASAEGKGDAQIEAPMETGPIPVAYTHDFDAYSNVVGTLNADGTKTAFVFFTAEDVPNRAESATGLRMPATMRDQIDALCNASQKVIECMDTTVYEDDPNTPAGSEETLCVGTHETRGTARTYMKFNLALLANTIAYNNILSAYINWNQVLPKLTNNETMGQVDTTYTSSAFEAYFTISSWTEALTWSSLPMTMLDYYGGEKVGVGNSNGVNINGTDTYIGRQIYITKAVMAWLQGVPNNGIVIKEREDRNESKFYSSNVADDSLRPYLRITYTDQTPPAAQGVVEMGMYYIVSRLDQKCISADSLTDGSFLHQTYGQLNTTDMLNQRWNVSSNDGTWFRILSATGLPYCLQAENNYGVTRTQLKLYDPDEDKQLWRFERSWNGSYRIFNKSSPTNCLRCNGGVLYGDNNLLYQAPPARYCTSSPDEWTLVPVETGIASLFCVDKNATNNIDTTYGMQEIADTLNHYQYFNSSVSVPLRYNTTVYQNALAATGYSAMQNSDLFFFSGHGAPGKLQFDTVPNTNKEYITTQGGTYSLTDLSPNSLARLRLARLSSCETGANDQVDEQNGLRSQPDNLPYNFVGQMYWLGCHNVIGHYNETASEEFYNGADAIWDSAFFAELLVGHSVARATQIADQCIYSEYAWDALTSNIMPFGNVNERHELGDVTYRPCYDYRYQQYRQDHFAYQAEPQLLLSYSSHNFLPVQYYDNNHQIKDLSSLFSLPTNSNFDTFDVYMDDYGGVYWCYAGTNKLHLYEPYTENKRFVDTYVTNTTAVADAIAAFVTGRYDLTDFSGPRCSNNYAKTYTVQYLNNTDSDIRLTFHFQQDLAGQVYMIDFIAEN